MQRGKSLSGGRSSRRRACTAFVVALGLLVLAACGGEGDGGSADDPLQVYFVSGLTGIYAPSAKAFERGIQAHVDWVNENGGIEGRKVEFSTGDNQSDPTRGVTLVQEQLNSDKRPDFIVPGVSSTETLAIAPLLTREKIPSVVSASSPLLDDVEKYPYQFSYCMLFSDVVEAAVPFMASLTGERPKVAVVVANDASGDSIADIFDGLAKKGDIEAEAEFFDAEAVDIAPAFQRAIASDPDWIYMEGAGAQVPTLLSSRAKAGAEDIPTIIGSSGSSQPLLELGTEQQLNNVYATLLPLQAYVAPGDRGEQFNEMHERVLAQGALEQPLYSYAAGWDMVGLWFDALRQTDGDTSAEAVKEAFESLPESDDPQFPIFRAGYTAESHYPGDTRQVTFGQLKSEKDDMLVIEDPAK